MSKPKKPDGFTFIEVIIGVLILGIVLVPLFDIFAKSNWHSVDAEKSTTALYLAQSVLEELKNKPFDDIKPVSDREYDGRPGYRYTVKINGPEDVNGYQVKHITVVVSYMMGNVTKQVSLTMEKTNRDEIAEQQM
ncbi:type IV pilus modification PilV family protein [Desulfotomaculum nigrificans]|uniref:type IV pilus modification PilV family protein n=1 Tax=Desulfotomaculum nigrificans TaxID=1565 RepID=UPI0001FAE7E1|nr:prepilin-type N-terminal cleavage/methylation domain-containing protein [Desulfotomaculum nigrificans]